ncbi:MAG TPA: hypothetical protein VMK42_10220 [Anaeromyxobacteraceae bacterium]|nr:hypothetical protein [Anaeromyxobacteraceae bacterium]
MRLHRVLLPSLALAGALACATAPSARRELPLAGDWVPQGASFGGLVAFRIRVDVHVRSKQFGQALRDRVEKQIERTLTQKGIAVAPPSNEPPPRLDQTGDIIVDVHVRDTEGGTAVAWDLHASQPVRLANGPWTFGSTWEVGDLIYPPTSATVVALRDSLQPALEEFCKLYLAARDAAPKAPEGDPNSTRADL